MTTEEYLRFHELRYGALVKEAQAAGVRAGGVESILVVGPSYETLLLAEAFPQATVNTIGRSDPRYMTPRGAHYEFDLNSIVDAMLPAHDLVVMAEVIEHLLVPPEAMLAWVREWLRPGGEAIVQTPNAVHLLRRWKMMLGENPYMKIPLPPNETYHVREYTEAELREAGERAGLVLQCTLRRNYFRHAGWRGDLLVKVGTVLPPSLREGITMCFRRPKQCNRGGGTCI